MCGRSDSNDCKIVMGSYWLNKCVGGNLLRVSVFSTGSICKCNYCICRK